MKLAPLAAAALVASAATLLASESQATYYTLWIHGRNSSQSTTPGNYGDFSYWGPSNTAAGINKKAVNWDGVSYISTSNKWVTRALDCYCTGSNWCYIAAHSAGDLQIGYALAQHGGTARSIKNGSPDATGTCANSGGTQTGWNIKWIDVASGAGGGSELANMGDWAIAEQLTSDLKTGTARAMYNHNTTRGVWFYMFAGAKGTLYSGTLPGQDDEAVSYHSTGGLSNTGGFCNPGDWFCDGTLELGTTASTKGGQTVAKWTNHTVVFRDTNEAHNHYSNGQWGGIVGVVRGDMVTYAK
jgi:hypothetical protein